MALYITLAPNVPYVSSTYDGSTVWLNATGFDASDGDENTWSMGFEVIEWSRSANEYEHYQYKPVDETFVVNLRANSYQQSQDVLRRLMLAQTISQAYPQRQRYSHVLGVSTSGIPIIDINSQYYAYVRNIRVTLPENDFRLLYLNGILKTEITLERTPYATNNIATTNTNLIASGIAPFVATFDLFPLDGNMSEHNGAFYFPSPVLSRLSNLQTHTHTPSGLLVYSNNVSDLFDIAVATGWTSVIDTSAKGGSIIRNNNLTGTNATVTYLGTNQITAPYAAKYEIYGTVMASGAVFEFYSGLGEFTGSTTTNIVYSNPVRIPNTYPNPRAQYLGTIASSTQLGNTVAFKAVNKDTTSGMLYIDTLLYVPHEHSSVLPVSLSPQTKITGGNANILLGSKWANMARYGRYDHSVIAGSLGGTEYPFHSYTGDIRFWAEYPGMYFALLFTNGTKWSHTTSGGSNMTIVIAGDYQPLYPYMPRF